MRRPVALGPLFLVLLALAGLVGAYAWWSTHRAPAMALRLVPVPDADLTAWRAALAATPRVPPPEDAPLLAAFAHLHRAEVETAALELPEGQTPASPSTLAAAALAWEHAAQAYVSELTPELYVDLGRRQADAFLVHLEALLAFCAQERLAPDTCLTTRTDAAPVAAYIPAGGLFLRFAVRAGFTEADAATGAHRLVPGRRPLVLVAFLDHWTRAVRAALPVEGFLTAREAEWLARWRAELQLDGPTDGRVAAALALAHVPDYPAELNAGVLLFQAGRFAEAAEHFRRAPEPEAADYLRLALATAPARP